MCVLRTITQTGGEHDSCNAPDGTPRRGLKALALENCLITPGNSLHLHNKVPNCTKDKALDPLGVCSIYSESGEATITCPIRFREDWIIAEDAASFFFPGGTSWTCLTEIRLKDGNGLSSGNINVVLVAYDAGRKTL